MEKKKTISTQSVLVFFSFLSLGTHFPYLSIYLSGAYVVLLRIRFPLREAHLGKGYASYFFG